MTAQYRVVVDNAGHRTATAPMTLTDALEMRDNLDVERLRNRSDVEVFVIDNRDWDGGP